jgi:hypothetical protein
MKLVSRTSFLLVLAFATPVLALDLRVGVGPGCDHGTLEPALIAVRSLPGSHTIRINKGSYPVPDGVVYVPTVSQTAVLLEGGYDSCTSPSPSGSPTTDAQRAVFNGAGGLSRSVLDLALLGRVGTFQMRRITLTGGDAFNVEENFNAGGGLAIRGRASVLLGLGTSIRGNGAGRGGGVALIGGAVTTGSTPDKVDLFIDEGAEISANSAAAEGGGVYCGGAILPGQPNVLRHGSIVLRDGVIGSNTAPDGAAFHCYGSLEGGGGFQPRPRDNRLAWLLANDDAAAPGPNCAAGMGTLDAGLPAGSDGFRELGAAPGGNGLLAITSHSGERPALCLSGSYQLGTTSIPAAQSRFRLFNLLITQQSGRDVLGLRVDSKLELEVAPSGDAVTCSFFGPVPCVTVFANDHAGAAVGAIGDPVIQVADGELTLRRASIRDNRSRRTLLDARASGDLLLIASIVRDNAVDPFPPLAAEGTQMAAVVSAGRVLLGHTTARFATPLDRFVRNDAAGGAGTAIITASILSSTAGVPATAGGSAAPSQLRLQYCVFLQSPSLAGYTVIPDPVSGVFYNAASLQLDPVTLAPNGPATWDRCSGAAGVMRDFNGQPFGVLVQPGATLATDLGAIEVQVRPDAVFANGFEAG